MTQAPRSGNPQKQTRGRASTRPRHDRQAMKSPKPAPKGQPQLNAAELTTRGTPRKRAAGAGRPALTEARCKNLPRVTVAAHQHLHSIATRQNISLADALELAILNLHRRSTAKPTGHQVQA